MPFSRSERLSNIVSFSIVIAGLDPAIHARSAAWMPGQTGMTFNARGRIALSGGCLRSPGPVGGSISVSYESAAQNRCEARRRQPWRYRRPVAAASLYCGVAMSRYYHGPVSDHFDGERFFDAGGAPPRSRRDLLRWRFHRCATRAKWPAWAPSPYADRPPPRVEGAIWRICFVGHASFLIQTAGRNILLDPIWSKRASPFRCVGPKRVNDPGIAFADLPPIDTVLVSHGHYDHLDLATLSRLAAAHRPPRRHAAR